ncbi:331_t:CDS:2, partial [Gigaspora rosea]
LGGKATIWYIYSKFGIAEDGSHMNLFEAPSKLNKEVYFARKRHYAIHLQAFVDNQFMMPKYSEILVDIVAGISF